MKDENGNEFTQEQLLRYAANHVSEACCLLFETNSDEGHAAAFMADYLLKYLQVTYRGDDVLLATADYNRYEEEVYEREKKQSLEVIK